MRKDIDKYIYMQKEDGSCGPVSLRMILASYGVKKSEKELVKLTNCTYNGTSIENMIDAAKSLGFNASYSDNNTWEGLHHEVHKNGPVIVNWFSQITGHYSPVYDIYKNEIVLADPEYGFVREMKKNEFLPLWFDFKKDIPETPADLILRRMMIVRPKR